MPPLRVSTFLLFLTICFALPSEHCKRRTTTTADDQHTLQSVINALRHVTAISNLPDTFGKQRSMLLSRALVSKRNVWKAVHPFSKCMLSSPSTLDWYISSLPDEEPKTIVIHGAYSCLDLGKSTGEPISFWLADNLTRDFSTKDEVGGFKRLLINNADNAPDNDITVQCLEKRMQLGFQPGRRLTEHKNLHDGSGVQFVIPKGNIDKPESIVDDIHFFERQLSKRRGNKHFQDVYDDSGLGVVASLTFDTGYRAWAPSNFTTDITLDLRVPMIPLAALTAHSHSRLAETNVSRAESRTSNSLLLLSMWATGLGLLLASWYLAGTVSDVVLARAQRLREMDVRSAVDGIGGWSLREKALVCGHVLGASILIAPAAQAGEEGLLNPLSMIEMTSGASVFYSHSRGDLSIQDNNPVAGAVFVVSIWVQYREVNQNFALALMGSSLLILVLCIVVYLRMLKPTDEIMSPTSRAWKGFSFWKLAGWIRMKYRAEGGKHLKRYKVLVLWRKNIFLHSCEDVDDSWMEMKLMANKMFRFRARTIQHNRIIQDRQAMTLVRTRKAAHERFGQLHWSGCYGMFSRVKMCDATRHDLTNVFTRPWSNHMPREWEILRRACNTENSVEYFRANGRFPPDQMLFLVKLGLLKHARHIESVKWCLDTDDIEYDSDGVRSVLLVGDPPSELVTTESFRNSSMGCPTIEEVGSQEGIFPSINLQPPIMDVVWEGSDEEGDLLNFPGGRVRLRYYIADMSLS